MLCRVNGSSRQSIHCKAAAKPLLRLLIARCKSAQSDSAVLDQEIEYFAGKKQVGVTLRTLMETGIGSRLEQYPTKVEDATAMERVQIQVASFIHRELPVRLAHRVKEIESIPLLREAPSVRQVQDWYKQSFQELREVPAPTNVEKEAHFAEVIEKVYRRHAPTLATMARGAYEARQMIAGDWSTFAEHRDIHRFLDKFYLSRIGIRMILGQYLALREPPAGPDFVGLVNLRTSPVEIAMAAIEDAKYMCVRQHGDAPEVTLHGRLDLHFMYIPSHIHYILLELLKNSMRATMEYHGHSDKLPAIRVIIADGEENEDVVIKISDEGGGIPRSHMDRVWSYLFTTADPAVVESMVSTEIGDFDTASPLAGLGYGLPISRSYTRYFGGELSIMSMEGYGTDAFVYLSRLGDRDEPLP